MAPGRGPAGRERNPAVAAGTLRAAAEAAEGLAPLTAAVHPLALRSRITLRTPPARDPYGLTERERLVLRLLARGYTNARIGAELVMSPKTASVHVSSTLRKLNVTNRAEAAAVAERAGLTGPDV